LSYPHVITHEEVNLYIAILDISDLHLHEEIIPNLLYEEDLYLFEE